ncbi:MAG: hypothetical protein HOP15_02460, partial [Planctomycetes bacterium]|nr:hypothetical protein [Planctomycetota bacterium]
MNPLSLLAGVFLCSGIPRALLFGSTVVIGALPTLAQSSPPVDFALEDVLLGLEQPTSIRFLPDGRMLVLQKQGEILIADVSGSPASAASYLDLGDPAHADGINGDSERGLLDAAIDPSFPVEPYVYLFYTPANGSARIARFTHAESDGGLTSQGDLSSEVVLWQDTEGYDSCCHFGGGLDFGPDGNLWLTIGDHFQGSYAASLEKAGGGIIRIEKNGNIPADNPYADGTGPQVDSKFAYGLRNPFRARWDLPTGRLLIGEVGGNEQMKAWEDLHVLQYDLPSGRFVDGDFGTAKDDGVFDGLYFGWPTVEGLPPHTDFPAADIQPIAEPIFAYPHNGDFSSFTGGVVYRGSQFPAAYAGAYFYGDSTRNFVRYIQFDPDGAVVPNPSPSPIGPKNPEATSYPFDLSPVGQIVCLEVGPEGCLYYVSFNDAGGGSGEFQLGSVRRYVYEPANARPIITQFTAVPAAGLPPLDVVFTVEATDPEAEPLSFTLDFGDAQAPVTQALVDGSPVTVGHSYATDGAYHGILQVTDGLQITSEEREIRVGNPPVIAQLVSTNSNPEGFDDVFRFGDVMTFAAEATDQEDGPLSGENFSWSVSFIRPGATHPALGPEIGSTSILFPIPLQGQGFSGPVFYRCYLTVRDSSGLTTTESLDIFPDKVNVDFSSVPEGIAIQVDGNTTRLTPFTLDSLINFDHVITAPQTRCIGGIQYDFAGWSNGPATVQQVYNVPPVDSALSAMYTAVGPCNGPPEDGLVMHLDASTGLTLSGNSVVSWSDETVFGNELFSAGSPVRLPAEFNGLDVVHFDGIDDALGRSGFLGLPTGSTGRSLFLVGRYNAPNPNGSSWAGFVYGTTASNSAFGLALTPAGILGVQGWGASDASSNPPTNGVGGLLSQSALYEGGLLTQYKTGAPIGTVSRLFATGTTAIRLGEELGGGKNLDMDVAAVLVYDRAVTETERIGIESYFENRYQITLGGGNSPDVRILAPNNGSAILTSEMPITLSAVASDFEDGDLGSSIVWSSKLDGVLGTGANLSATLSEGQHLIVARVEDSSLLQNTDEVNLLVTSSFKGLITSGLVLHLEADQNVTIQSGSTVAGWLDGSAFGNDLLANGNPQWVEGLTPAGLPAVHLDGDGDSLERVHASHPLLGFPTANADRTLFVLVRYLGSSAWAGVAYGTAATNQAFGLIVKHPTGELVLQGYSSGDLVSSTLGIGTGWLVHSGTLASGIGRMFRDGQQIAQWSHIYDTGLDKLVIGAEITDFGYVTADVAAVLVYDRALGDSERASVESYLYDKYLAPNTAPILSILMPKDGSLHSAGVSIQFSGVASDKQDGDLSPALEWNSSLDGFLGTGGSISSSALSPGTHTITASVTDSGGLNAIDAITLVVNAAPVVDITSPAAGSVPAKVTELPT